MRNVKLAFVGNSAVTMYNFRASLLADMVQKGYDVTVLVPVDTDLAALNSIGVKVIPIRVDCRGTNPRNDMALLWQLMKIYRQEQFDFIFHYTIKPVIYGSMAATITKTPYISVVTGLGYTFIHNGLLKKATISLYKLALKKAKEVWFLNEDDKNVFLEERVVSVQKAFVLNGEGINTEFFHPQPKKKEFFSFIFIGRILWDKGIGEYIDAVRLLKKRYPEIRFQILGPLGAENPAAVAPEDMRAWVNDGIVDYLGETKNVASYIANCDCVVLPSYREGLSRILLEAASMERPIVATDVSGCREIVEDGVNGYLCKPHDVESLSACMERMYLLGNEGRAAMGKAGRNKMLKTFDDRIINAIYNEKLKKYLGESK